MQWQLMANAEKIIFPTLEAETLNNNMQKYQQKN
jgi:hypothetical protein